MKQGIEKGVAALIGSQLVMVISGYILNAGLGRLWGPEQYGFFVVIISILVWLELAVTSGIPAAIKKNIAEREDRITQLLYKGIKAQVLLSIIIVLIVFFIAPLLADFLGDKRVTKYLRLASIDIPFMGFLVLYWDALGGLRAFTRKALVIAGYGLFKTTIIIALVFAGFSLKGAFIGNILASIAALLIAIYLLPLQVNAAKLKSEGIKIYKFAVPVTLYGFSYNLLIILDLILVKTLLEDQKYTGYYASALTIAKIPYVIFFAFTLTLLPLLSRSISKGDKKLSESHINKTMRYLLILLLPLVLIINETSSELLSLVYSTAYIQAASTLSILIFGFGIFSIFLTLNIILIANDESNKVLFITLIIIPVSLFLNLKLIPLYGIEGAAMATTISMMIGLMISIAIVYSRFGVFIDIKSFARISVSALVTYLLALTIPASGIFVLLKYVFLFSIYFVILYLIGGVEEKEKEQIMNFFKSKRFFLIRKEYENCEIKILNKGSRGEK